MTQHLTSRPITSRNRAVVVGTAITATGVLHLAIGAIAFREPLPGMARAGVLNSLDGRADRQATPLLTVLARRLDREHREWETADDRLS